VRRNGTGRLEGQVGRVEHMLALPRLKMAAQSPATCGLDLGPDYLFQKSQGLCFVSVNEDNL